MTIEEIISKTADKDKRISDMDEKIKAVQAEIVVLDTQRQSSVQSGSAEQAVKLMKERRDKEDELQVLCQVADNIKATPAISQSDILETWGGVCDKVMTEYEKEVLPELQAAYTRYCQVVEKIVALRQKAQAPAAQLEGIAKGQGFNMVLSNPFRGVKTHKYAIQKPVLVKLNCLYNPIMDEPISRPVSFEGI